LWLLGAWLQHTVGSNAQYSVFVICFALQGVSNLVRIWIVNQFANTLEQPGPTRQYEMARHLVERGHDVTVIASDFNTELRVHTHTGPTRWMARDNYEGIGWCWLYAVPYRVNDWRRYMNLVSFCIALMLASLRLKRPDVIIGSSPQLPAAYVAWIIARLTRARFVFEARDLWPQVLIDMAGKRETDMIVRVLRSIERAMYVRSEAVIVLARGAIEYVIGRGAARERTYWLPNSVHVERFAVESSRSELRERHNLPDDAFVALYAGAHGDANALHSVVEAARLLAADAPGLHIALFGDGPAKPSLVELAQGLTNISFHDPVPKTAIAGVLATADVGLLLLRDVALFRYGVSPNKLYDYYAAGIPVIVAVGGDVNSEVEEEGVGFGIEPENPVRLAEAIRACASLSQPQRYQMGRRAFDLVRRRYDRSVVAEELHRLLGDLGSVDMSGASRQ
jgi:glycosyltransferase involved in cell wall biosynthesis